MAKMAQILAALWQATARNVFTENVALGAQHGWGPSNFETVSLRLG